MDMFVVMRENSRGGWSMLRKVGSDEIAGFRTADEAWRAIFDQARESGKYTGAKVERVVICK